MWLVGRYSVMYCGCSPPLTDNIQHTLVTGLHVQSCLPLQAVDFSRKFLTRPDPPYFVCHMTDAKSCDHQLPHSGGRGTLLCRQDMDPQEKMNHECEPSRKKGLGLLVGYTFMVTIL